jgi:Reverse transcriptase (RNA-dependent DNA polymerase)
LRRVHFHLHHLLHKCASSFSLLVLSFGTPIFKNGKRNDVSNYRRIAILSAVAKSFKLLICRCLYDDPALYGFKLNRILLVHSEDDGKWIPDPVYTDFSKAFDKVCHCLLLLKFTLSPIDLARCELLRSYLSGWIQHIRIGSCISSEIKVTSGVPQGSYFGPLCFIWFVNEITLIFKYV